MLFASLAGGCGGKDKVSALILEPTYIVHFNIYTTTLNVAQLFAYAMSPS